ncbi:MarR family transcriptional regulator [Desulfolucanica intricata]|uniref:MarR family transcriptional regulator n=1 Tax=Desulfolucanica intricata TaxID=1285191 RepID=UPI0008347F84|nr:MarR family transcriptional regulator [Desulfolucanica intricata]
MPNLKLKEPLSEMKDKKISSKISLKNSRLFPVEDSIFAKGTGMIAVKTPINKKVGNLGRKAFTILEYLSEAEALTTSALSNLMGYYRYDVKGALKSLVSTGLVREIEVATSLGIFKLWVKSDIKLPQNAQEACRLAALGLFYAWAKKEVPNFEWSLLKIKKKPVMAEMTFLPKGQMNRIKWLIDVPRRGEKPHPNANIFIFPTLAEGKSLAPQGKRFTCDLLLMVNDGADLSQKIFEVS